MIKYLFSLYVWSFVCLQKASVSLEDNGVLEEKSCSRSSYTLPILDGQTVRRSIDWQRNGTRNDRASLGPWNSTTWEAATLENCGSLISPNRWVIFYFITLFSTLSFKALCIFNTKAKIASVLFVTIRKTFQWIFLISKNFSPSLSLLFFIVLWDTIDISSYKEYDWGE